LKVNSFTGFITYENVFEYFVENYYNEKMEIFTLELAFLNIISRNIITVDKTESIIKILEIMYDNKISTIPIFDKENSSLYGIFYLKDLIYLFNNDEKFTVMANCLILVQ